MREESSAKVSESSDNPFGLLDTFQYLGLEAKALGQEFIALVGAELSLAASSIPKLIVVGLAALFLVMTSWLSICAAIAFGSYAITGLSWLAFVIFAALQVVALFTCKLLMARFIRYLSLPYSRQFFNDLQRGAHESESTP